MHLLPTTTLLEVDGETYHGFSDDGFKVILKIYARYQDVAYERLAWSRLEAAYILDLDLAERRRAACEDVLGEVNKDRELAWDMRDAEVKARRQEKTKGQIGAILGAVGGVLGGFAIGILVGIFGV